MFGKHVGLSIGYPLNLAIYFETSDLSALRIFPYKYAHVRTCIPTCTQAITHTQTHTRCVFITKFVTSSGLKANERKAAKESVTCVFCYPWLKFILGERQRQKKRIVSFFHSNFIWPRWTLRDTAGSSPPHAVRQGAPGKPPFPAFARSSPCPPGSLSAQTSLLSHSPFLELSGHPSREEGGSSLGKVASAVLAWVPAGVSNGLCRGRGDIIGLCFSFLSFFLFFLLMQVTISKFALFEVSGFSSQLCFLFRMKRFCQRKT